MQGPGPWSLTQETRQVLLVVQRNNPRHLYSYKIMREK
jgi:hypothetical protein